MLRLGVIEYLGRDRTIAIQTYDSLIEQAKPRLASEFATDADTALLGTCYFARGFVKAPGQLPVGPQSKSFIDMPIVEALVTAQRTRGLLSAFLDTLNQPAATRAEAWFDQSARAFDSIKDPARLTPKDREVYLHSLVGSPSCGCRPDGTRKR